MIQRARTDDVVLVHGVVPQTGFELVDDDGDVVEARPPGEPVAIACELRRDDTERWRVFDIAGLGETGVKTARSAA